MLQNDKMDIILKQGVKIHGQQAHVCIVCTNNFQSIQQDFHVTQLKSPCIGSLKSVNLKHATKAFGD